MTNRTPGPARTPVSPLFLNKETDQPSVFRPEALVREARRQKKLPNLPAPDICVLDPDGDILRRLMVTGQASRCEHWPCYHSNLHLFRLAGHELGIVGNAVGAPFAVLIAEQLFAIDCKLLISVTSAGQVLDRGPPPYFVLIERALRDEGASHHYLPPSEFAEADPRLVAAAGEALRTADLAFHIGATWTIDAPFRETRTAIEAARALGLLAVEMEAAALYALAKAGGRNILCLAHVTNVMGQSGEDFEKGEEGGAVDALRAIEAIVGRLSESEFAE